MDAKDLRTEAALGDRSNDGNTKYAQGGGALPCHRTKTYQDIGSHSLGKVDGSAARPCAVIGPDRVVPPPVSNDNYLKKGPLEPWLSADAPYRRPPDYPHKMLDYQNPARNISPRQTFQENMQRIMVPPSYNTLVKEDHNFPGDATIPQMRINKQNVSTDSNPKYCEVPYTVNPLTNEQKIIRNSETSALNPNMNHVLTRSVPQSWPPANTNIRPSKPYPQDLYQYPEYSSCAGPRPIIMPRTHRNLHEEPSPVYPEGYYHDANIRFKPYPAPKERYPQSRYEYVGHYSNPFHPPPPFPSHKYEMQKTMPSHPYPGYPQVPIKYLDGRIPEPIMNGYQRPLTQQPNYNNMPFRNHVIHPNYGPVPSNCLQTSNKYYPYPPDSTKSMLPHKLPYDANSKNYAEYEMNRSKNYAVPEGFYVNDIGRSQPMKGQVLPPNYPVNMHPMAPHPYYRKDGVQIRGYEYNPHLRNMDPSLNINANPLSRFPSQFSPSTIAISPSDSNTSNDTNQTSHTSQEDCGYVSQSSTASGRSVDSNRLPHDIYRRYDHRYLPLVKNSHILSKRDINTSANAATKNNKDIDVRQFLQMWNEGEDESAENKDVVGKTISNNSSNSNHYETPNQEQLYVLGLVNVPSEELDKYEHIQKVSKLPENIKGYNSIELLHQFEEVIESSNLNNISPKPPQIQRDFHAPLKGALSMHGISIPSRPLSPLDVEAKISQSVIHKEVGCNFEIKPCSPKMLNVEVATPVQTVFGERVIEKVSNPLIIQSAILKNTEETKDLCNISKCQDRNAENSKVASCKMVNTQYDGNNPIDTLKANYSLQDLESNSGVCLASLPRLDNDIELNFPEVNQQFINANKAESVITATPLKDLPTLENDSNSIDHISLETEYCATKGGVDKDLSKLSKYRKLKRKNLECHTPEPNVQALRTDSVIIKNPENNKTQDFAEVSSPKCSSDAQNDPINLSVTTDHLESHNQVRESASKTLNFNLNVDAHLGDDIISTSILHENNSSIQSDDHLIELDKTIKDYGTSKSKNEYDAVSQNIRTLTDIENNKGASIVANSSGAATCEESYKDFDNSSKCEEFTMTSQTDSDENLNIQKEENYFHENILQSLEAIDPEYNVMVHNNEESNTNIGSVTLDKPKTPTELICNFDEPSDVRNSFTDINIHNDKNTTKANFDFEENNQPENLEKDQFKTTIVEKNNVEEGNSTSLTDKSETKTTKNQLEFCPQVSNTVDDLHNNSEDYEMNNPTVKSYRPKIRIYKELWSPFIQKLFIYNEGRCPIKNRGNFNDLNENETCEFQPAHDFNSNETGLALVQDNTTLIDVTNTSDCNVKYNNEDNCEIDLEITDCLSTIDNKSIKTSHDDIIEEIVKDYVREESLERSKIQMEDENLTTYNSDTSFEPTDQEDLVVKIADKDNSNTSYQSAINVDLGPKIVKENNLENDVTNKDVFNQISFREDLPSSHDKDEKLIDSIEAENTETCFITNSTKKIEIDDSGLYGKEFSCINSEDNLNDTESNISATKTTELINADASHLNMCLPLKNSNSPAAKSASQCLNYFESLNEIKTDLGNKPEADTSEESALPLAECSCNTNISDLNEILLPTSLTVSEDSNSAEEPKSEIPELAAIEPENCIENNANKCDEEEHPTIENVIEGNGLAHDVLLNENTISSALKSNEQTSENIEKLLVQNESSLINIETNFVNLEQIHQSECMDNVSIVTTELSIPISIKESKLDEIQLNTLSRFHKYDGDKRITLKRSLSDSALNKLYDNMKDDCEAALWPNKRKKNDEMESDIGPHLFEENYCNIVHNIRRNSISSIQNGENVSFCILIDNDCIITESDGDTEKLCFTSVSEECLACIPNDSLEVGDTETNEIEQLHEEENCDSEYSAYDVNCSQNSKTLDEPWAEDIAYVETVETDDIAENIVISASTSPKDEDVTDGEGSASDEESYTVNEHTDKLKYIYGDKMCSDNSHFMETLYRTPQMNVDKTLNIRESQISEDCSRYYDKESLELVLSEPNNHYENCNSIDIAVTESTSGLDSMISNPDNKENFEMSIFNSCDMKLDVIENYKENDVDDTISINYDSIKNACVDHCESSIDEVFSYRNKSPHCTNSSSPEVSSTTSEEKNTSILLKITNFGGSRVSQVNDVNNGSSISCKYTEQKEYLSTNSNLPTRTLITKAAQKYIPPLKETIPDLKVKLPLPQHSLIKLKQLKITKETPKSIINKSNNNMYVRKDIPKKSKPKFEDVLMSIDEIQYQKHKERNKRVRKSIPKVVIKKSHNGSHYASTSKKDTFNPDLTGRKWQPWVFLEKNCFIDKMALRKKTRAIFNHRKNTYVLAEKFKKYKSAGSTKFVITQPKLKDSSPGQLKYTIKLKHHY